jgi:outer membrane protein OmpA-like peptidoglycan-associated protein
MQAQPLFRTAAATLPAALLALSACGSGDDDTADAGRDTIDRSSAGSSANAATDDTDAGSHLDRESTDASSDLEREVTEALSELDAETRAGDTVVTLPDRVLFAFNQHELLPEAMPVLDDLVQAIDYFADAPVQVNGHTDSVGSEATNQTLSEQRAQAVGDYFTDAGIDPSRLHAQGFGETQPVAPNTNDDGSDNPDGRAQNRRVEIIIEDVDLSTARAPGTRPSPASSTARSA